MKYCLQWKCSRTQLFGWYFTLWNIDADCHCYFQDPWLCFKESYLVYKIRDVSSWNLHAPWGLWSGGYSGGTRPATMVITTFSSLSYSVLQVRTETNVTENVVVDLSICDQCKHISLKIRLLITLANSLGVMTMCLALLWVLIWLYSFEVLATMWSRYYFFFFIMIIKMLSNFPEGE